MTIDEIEAMSEEEYARLSLTERAALMEIVLESLCSEGLAYRGVDGRYRIREDVAVSDAGVIVAAKPN